MKDDETPEGPALPQTPEASDGAKNLIQPDADDMTLSPSADVMSETKPDSLSETPDSLSETKASARVDDDIAPIPAQPVPAPRRRGGFFAALLGGALAAVGGFALSHYNLFELRPDVNQADVDARISAVEAQIKAETGPVQEQIKALAARADAAEADLAAARQALAQSEPAMKALNDRLNAMDQALKAATASTEGGASAAALAALATEVEALRSRAPSDASETRAIVDEALKAWEADATARANTQAEAAKEQALAEAAKLALAQAIDTGAPYDTALAAIDAADLPPALTQFAETGLPTLAALQDTFPDAARAALEASLRDGQTGEDKFWSFLRIQTGARSLTPQEGNDPDAILSRAEAALKADDLPKALAEIAQLPPEGQAAMASWVAAAKTRADAKAAIQPLTSNP